MINRDYFSHDIPGYGSVFKKLDAKGYCYKLAGENIGWNTYPDDVATAAIHKMFMDSSGHRENILGKAWDVIGVGAYKGADGKKMWTVLFADKCGCGDGPEADAEAQARSRPPSPSPSRSPSADAAQPTAEADAEADAQADPEADAHAHADADADPRRTAPSRTTAASGNGLGPGGQDKRQRPGRRERQRRLVRQRHAAGPGAPGARHGLRIVASADTGRACSRRSSAASTGHRSSAPEPRPAPPAPTARY